MNANVFLRADRGTMSLPCWPDEIRYDQTCLEECKCLSRTLVYSESALSIPFHRLLIDAQSANQS